MLVSRTLAKRRIADNMRPGFVAAWWPVLFDTALLFAVMALVWVPLQRMVAAADMSVGLTIGLMFAVFFFPMQIVVITSAMWAARSRWDDTDSPK